MKDRQENGLPSPWLMWIVAAAFYCYGQFLQISPGVMAHGIMRSFHISSTDLGHLAAFYFYAYALMQLPVGLLIDRYGARRLLTLSAGICAIGCLMFSSAHSYPIAAAGRLITGLGTSFAIVGCLNLISAWFPSNRFAILTGLTLAVATFGLTIGLSPFAWMVTKLHWHKALLLLSILGTFYGIDVADST